MSSDEIVPSPVGRGTSILADVQEESLRRAGDIAVPALDTHACDGIFYNRQGVIICGVTIAIVQTTKKMPHLVQRS